MTDEELLVELEALGLDRGSYRAVLLLPLIQVAWADGRVQASERELILRVALDRGVLGEAGTVLDNWLEQCPDSEMLARGRRLLVALTLRHRGLGSELGPDTLDTVHQQCVQVARAAGGLLDTFFTVDPSEHQVLAEIRAGLDRARATFLDDLPSPSGGSFEDL